MDRLNVKYACFEIFQCFQIRDTLKLEPSTLLLIFTKKYQSCLTNFTLNWKKNHFSQINNIKLLFIVATVVTFTLCVVLVTAASVSKPAEITAAALNPSAINSEVFSLL